MNVLHVLGRLVALEPAQAALLERICAGPLVSADDVKAAIAVGNPADMVGGKRGRARSARQMDFLD
jgi:hypothetical protein